ncbi:cytosolic Fe-S cluster assembly factor NAR1 [Blastomyces dermatitidis ER-3]|uniref:Cytosolic Fe-S cluster assembly factor NAR1 n=2 Tax=Ajellomyces dermatitidis TaxID=5039 RepID=F2TH99_AJEDA|nr:cytosolic Fe-S cluster assembly factor NAR1 [Blastomyces dermatitidis ER-3]EEQ85606.1 cytosolic Fe-S cluster assembly factor NAR1 [Blastomyces dermatitidis ER-3]EGE82612.1 cytosolic Fe-S cluster assembly factor NAR1 [Blastomyces dermatitidis ATCC 18188]
MSAILSADDLNDFISPGVACIKPIETLPHKEVKNSENAYEVTTEDKIEPENLPPAQISLTDCLACSGCVTSAEAVLVSLQSHAEVLNTLDSCPELRIDERNGHGVAQTLRDDAGFSAAGQQSIAEGDKKIFIASVSPQVRASLAATYGISERKAGWLIEQFLGGPQGLRAGGAHGNGFAWVVDTNVMRQVFLELSVNEVMESLEDSGSPSLEGFPIPKRPVLSSACPGWICYAEKTHPHVLPHISRLKSPQALTGTLLKTVLSKALNISPAQIWHLAIMPCFDKKLEASRQELTDASWQSSSSTTHSPVRDVDCVITSREVLMLATSRNISLQNLPLQPLPSSYTPLFPDPYLASFLFPKSGPSTQPSTAGTSGGYLFHILTAYQHRNPGSQIQTQRGRNSDVIEYSLTSPSGDTIIKAARYYGFRNIQNLVRKLKPPRASRLPGAKPMIGRRAGSGRATAANNTSATDYAYVEVMACPGGCTNGGGQIRVEDVRDINTPKQDTINPLQQDEQPQPQSTQKSTPQEQRAWLARVDEAYFSADSDSDSNSNTHPIARDRGHRPFDDLLSHWSRSTNIPLEKLVYTTFRKVESDVGKEKGKDPGGMGDMARVAELAGKAGGGW